MGKNTMYFNSTEEMNNYFQDGVPSNVLAIVKGEEGKSVLFTTSNNESTTGTMEDQGGYNIDEDTQGKIEVSYEFATYTGASKEYVADYVSTYGGGDAPDMTAYVSKLELSNCSYITMNDVSACGYVTAQDVPAPDLSAYATKWQYFGDQGTSFYETNNTVITNDSSYVLFSNTANHTYYPNGKINFTYEKFLRYYVPSGIETNPHSIESINKDFVLSADSSSNLGGYPHQQIMITQTGYVFVSGIGGATDSNIRSNSVTTDMSLQAVINDIQTTLGTAASVAEAIIGE